jgi:hypothetical protein
VTQPIKKFARGARVSVRNHGLGTVVDDYWRYKDRFRVRLDDYKADYDFGEAVMIELSTPSNEGAGALSRDNLTAKGE